MNAIHPSATNADLPESDTPTLSASATVYSGDLYYFVGKYQENYPSFGARVLAQNIADLYRPDLGYAYATQTLLADIMNISVSQVRVLLKEVEASGYWDIQRGANARNEATRYRPIPSELARAARWKAAKFDRSISFTDPKVRAKSTKVATSEPRGFVKDRRKKAAAAPAEPVYVFKEGIVPEWGRPDPDETVPEPDIATETDTITGPDATEPAAAEPETDTDPFGSPTPSVLSQRPSHTREQQPAHTPEQHTATTEGAGPELDPFGNPFPTYAPLNIPEHL